MDIEEATFKDIMDEVASRAPGGVLIVFSLEAKNDRERHDVKVDYRGSTVNAIGMADFAKKFIYETEVYPNIHYTGD